MTGYAQYIDSQIVCTSTSFPIVYNKNTGKNCVTNSEISEYGWLPYEFSPITAEELREQAKAVRAEAVANIKVTVNGKVFDGDEISQTRMARAIIGMQATGQPTLTWVLADNTPTEATLAELTEAMCLAGQAQANIWVI